MALEAEVERRMGEFAVLRDGIPCYSFDPDEMTVTVVDDVFDDLRGKFGTKGERLAVFVFSGGGSIDVAYNLGMLFRRYAARELLFVVPRWAKSAATLLAAAGDRILMSPVAELGPLDPQWTIDDPAENRHESFSPLAIESTLQLIRDEYRSGSEKLAAAMMERLQFPLTLGSFKKSLDVADQYICQLLTSRMLKHDPDAAKRIGRQLTTGYAAHSYCINADEARGLGLVVDDLSDAELEIVWRIHQLGRQRIMLRVQSARKQLKRRLQDLPPGAIPMSDDKEDRDGHHHH